MRGYFKMKEEVWVDDGCEEKHSSEGPGDKGDKAAPSDGFNFVRQETLRDAPHHKS